MGSPALRAASSMARTRRSWAGCSSSAAAASRPTRVHTAPRSAPDMRRCAAALACLGALMAGPAPADAPPDAPAPHSEAYQARFLQGVAALQAGDPMRAATIFEQLLAETGSPRVKLELAR